MSLQPPAPKIALVAMPWTIFNRPSIQLSALKAFLEQRSDFQAELHHPYLAVAKAIGIEDYARISLSGWAGEALFSSLLFPEKQDDARTLFRQSLAKKDGELPDFDTLSAAIKACCDTWLEDFTAEHYLMVGFSVCFSQLLASLYLAQKIKEKHPLLPVVFGGSSCSGEVGRSMITSFTQIDYLIDGEGEGQLLALCRFLAGKTTALPEQIQTARQVDRSPAIQPIEELDTLPYPDYSDYFAELLRTFPGLPFIPVLPIEFSRGCWWNKCTFCNLNLQWSGYRAKTAPRMLEETHHLARKHESLHFTFTDNALPPKEADHFFTRLLETDIDFDFFAEIRSITHIERLKTYRRGGLRTVQIGIEALSSSLLEKMAKGTSAMDNIAVMKMCSALGIRLEGNLIIEFPTATPEEVAKTLTHLDHVLPFTPLQPAAFFLGFGSPISRQLDTFGISTILTHPKNRRILPAPLLKSLTMLVNSYRGDRRYQQELWRPVRNKIALWHEFHTRRDNRQPHPLYYRDGGSFLIIRQERPSAPPLQHRLRGLSRKIYLFCEIPQQLESVLAAFPSISESKLLNFLDELTAKRLMFKENDRILALAIRHQ